jgi:hypothetical protein
MPLDLRISQPDWTQLRHHCRQSFRGRLAPETAAIGVLGLCDRFDRREFLLAKLFLPTDGDLKIAHHGNVVLSATYVRRAHLYMRENRLAGLVIFHTHPSSDWYVGFSPFDNAEEPLLVENLTEIQPGTILVSVVLGNNSQCGRVWEAPADWNPMSRLIVVGESIQHLPLNGTPAASAPRPEGIFDSAAALTGGEALALLRKMTIGIVGLSGTGSLVCELLTRAGCERILAVDDDVAEERNANRILHLTADDVKRKTPKIEISRRAAEETKIGCRVETIEGNVLDQTILARLRDSDIIFGCVDKAYPRKLLSEFAFRYLRPYIDVGTEIGADDRGIVSLDARASYVAPGRYCLMCLGIATPRQLHFESLAFDERERKIELRYCDDLVLMQPAVMDLNMRAASLGSLLLRHLLQPFLLEPLPLSITENLVTYTLRKVEKPRAFNGRCKTCRENHRLGFGDCGPRLGLDAATVAAIVGGKPSRSLGADRKNS